jgi:hypothetical protein
MNDRFDASEASDLPRTGRLEAVKRSAERGVMLRWDGVGEEGGESISMA